jgi:hypothetical protein
MSFFVRFFVTKDVLKGAVLKASSLSNVDGSFSSFPCSNAGQLALLWPRALAQSFFPHTCANSSEAGPSSQVTKVEALHMIQLLSTCAAIASGNLSITVTTILIRVFLSLTNTSTVDRFFTDDIVMEVNIIAPALAFTLAGVN